jgi:hypothetical protein
MAINKLPSRFVRMIPTQAQMHGKNSNVENLLFHLMNSFNQLRLLADDFSADSKLHPEDEFLQQLVVQSNDQLQQIANAIDCYMPGIVQDEIDCEITELQLESEKILEKYKTLCKKIADLCE